MRPTTVFLADLAHTHSVPVSALPVPLNIAYLKAHAEQVHGAAVEITLFKSPEALLAACAERPPEILGFSSYSWNENLCRVVADHLRTMLPETLFLVGGPNIDVEPARRTGFLRRNAAIDLMAIGAGEEIFTDLIAWWQRRGDRLCRDALPAGLVWTHQGELRQTPERRVAKDSPLPTSPYLSGALDAFLAAGMVPMFETNRGCPYRCTFCVWGGADQNVVRRFDLDVAMQEFDYVAERSRAENWILCDANFGMFPRDIELARHLRRLHDRDGYPRRCHLFLAKNVTARNLEIGSILRDMIYPLMSVQSLDPQVLRNIRRDNISIETYEHFVGQFQARGAETFSDLIVPLPGETVGSHLAALRRLMRVGVSIIFNHNLRLLPGAELNRDETLREFGIESRFRLIHGDAGVYEAADGTRLRAFEYEESPRRTSTMSEEDLFYLRRLHFLVELAWNLNAYRPLFATEITRGLDALDVLTEILRRAEAPSTPAEQEVGRLFDQFDADSRAEWFPSREAIETHFADPSRFQSLVDLEYDKLNVLYCVRVLRDHKWAFDEAFATVVREHLPATPEVEHLIAFVRSSLPGLSDEMRLHGSSLALPGTLRPLVGVGMVEDTEVDAPRAFVVRFTESAAGRRMRDLLANSRGTTLSKLLNARGMGCLALRELSMDVAVIDTLAAPPRGDRNDSIREHGEFVAG